jgi:hypothetical protein
MLARAYHGHRHGGVPQTRHARQLAGPPTPGTRHPADQRMTDRSTESRDLS